MLDPRNAPRIVRCTHCRAAAVDADRELCARHLVRWHVDSDDKGAAYDAAAEFGVSPLTVRRYIRDEAERQIRAEDRARVTPAA